MLLTDKVIVVTGGTGVLGQSFVEGIHAAGGTVCILGRNKEKAEQLAAKVRNNGGKALAVQADVLEETQLEEAQQQILETFGRVDGLVNAAGGNMPEGILSPETDVFDLNVAGTRKVLDLNLWGTVLPTQCFGKALADSGHGSIVNISSMSSQRVITKVLGYSMGKAAVDCYTQWMAVEMANRYGDRIRMNAIAPGFFLTEQNRRLLTHEDGSYTERGKLVLQQTPYRRFGTPEELIGALVWLLSDTSKFVTGTVVNVDGGFSVFSGV